MTIRNGGLVLVALCFLLSSLAAPAAIGAEETSVPETACEASAAVGGDNYFYCAVAQTLKIGGILTGNLALAVGGAIAGGITCGFGI